jgi:nucleoside-diphosphate-sugar epimerase
MRILVIGGAGMLGRAVMHLLQQNGHAVTSFDLEPCPDAAGHSIVGDIRDADAVTQACRGMDAVIHTAAYVNQLTGRQPVMYDVNVQGTLNIIAACQIAGVPRLIYTSSVDVVFDGTPIANGDERLPYPKRHLDYYSETKMLAEQAVIRANGVKDVATCSLRAAGLFGPHDRHRFPNIIPRVVRTGQYTIIGDGKSWHNHVYVENMAYAFVLAVERLSLDSPLAGQAYFITDYAPGNFFAFFKPYLDALGVNYTESRLPASIAMMMAQASERLSSFRNGGTPPLSAYAVAATSRHFWFNHQKATRDLGYVPIISEEDAFDRTLTWVRTSLLT